MSKIDTTPWAEGSLLDPTNVGKKVWFSHNNNFEVQVEIVKITRTNVHLDSNARTPYSLRVGDNQTGDVRHAAGLKNGFSIAAWTESYRLDREVRGEITKKVINATRSLNRYTTEHLARILAVIEDVETPTSDTLAEHLGPHYVTLGLTSDGVRWDLRSGTPDSASCRIKDGVAFTWAAALHQAGNEMMRRARDGR